MKVDDLELMLHIRQLNLTPNEYFFLRMSSRKRADVLNFDLEETEKSLVDKFGSIKLAQELCNIPTSHLDVIVEQYRAMFPKGKLPSGQNGRSSLSEVRSKMLWFFNNYQFSAEQVIEATRRYVERYKERNYQYMRNASYFIYKEDRNKIKSSLLSEECESLDQPEESATFGVDA
jgi:hypothetical protein